MQVFRRSTAIAIGAMHIALGTRMLMNRLENLIVAHFL